MIQSGVSGPCMPIKYTDITITVIGKMRKDQWRQENVIVFEGIM